MSTLSFGGRNSTHCFFSNPKNPQPTLPVHDVTHIPWSIPMWDFYFDISEWHILSTCALTPALMLHLINPCTEPKGSHPNLTKRQDIQNEIPPQLYYINSTLQFFMVSLTNFMTLLDMLYIFDYYLTLWDHMHCMPFCSQSTPWLHFFHNDLLSLKMCSSISFSSCSLVASLLFLGEQSAAYLWVICTVNIFQTIDYEFVAAGSSPF